MHCTDFVVTGNIIYNVLNVKKPFSDSQNGNVKLTLDEIAKELNVGGSAKKVGLRIKELDRLYGIKNGGSGFYGNQHSKNEELTNNFTAPKKTEKDIADMMGISRQQLQNYKKLTEMIPELEELVDTGIATPTTALAIMRNLSELEQLSPSLGWIKHCEKTLYFQGF